MNKYLKVFVGPESFFFSPLVSFNRSKNTPPDSLLTAAKITWRFPALGEVRKYPCLKLVAAASSTTGHCTKHRVYEAGGDQATDHCPRNSQSCPRPRGYCDNSTVELFLLLSDQLHSHPHLFSSKEGNRHIFFLVVLVDIQYALVLSRRSRHIS